MQKLICDDLIKKDNFKSIYDDIMDIEEGDYPCLKETEISTDYLMRTLDFFFRNVHA
jgi:hypothetical protein